MVDDFYEILSIKPNASLYKIALHYKMLAKKIILSNDENSKTAFYQINSAFEVLKKENVRKYYDVLYKISVQNKPTRIRFQTIEKYLFIVNNHILKGRERADKIINNKNPRLVKHIKRPLVLSFLIGTIKLYSRLTLITSPLYGFCMLIFGIITFLRTILGISSDLLGVGLWAFLWGIISIYANFHYFTIDVMNDEI
jgi:hypothetical protein